VKTGDTIELDVPAPASAGPDRHAEMMSASARGKLRCAGSSAVTARFSRHIMQANEGCDFDFLEGTAPTPEPEIH